MTDTSRDDLREQLALIERMMREGRRSTEYWGWSFVLWGVAYLVAIAWSYTVQAAGLVWPITMVAAALLTVAIAARKRRNQPETTVGRSIGAVWSAVGTAIFVFCFSAALSHHLEIHTFVGGIEAFLAVANLVSGTILRWRLQQILAGMWWTAAAATFFLGTQGILVVLVLAILIGNIGFGVYLMIREHREKAARAGQVLHA